MSFTARAGENGKLFGSITTHQLADRLNEVLGTEIDRRKVGTEALRQVGEHYVPVRLSADHHPEFLVTILAEGAPVVHAAPAAVEPVEAVVDGGIEVDEEAFAEEAEA